MTMVVTNGGEKLLLEAMVGKVAAGDLKLKLFTNDYTPAQDDVPGDFTEMGAVQGYAAKTLSPASWNAGVEGTGTGSAAANKAYIEYAQQTFMADGTGGAQTVYGYFITNNAGTVVVAAERFGSAQTFAIAGDLIKITPKLTCGTE